MTVTCEGSPRPPLGPGDGIGEIAVLRHVPRTATVSAAGPATVFALDREDFLMAVSAHARASQAADRLAEERLNATAA